MKQLFTLLVLILYTSVLSAEVNDPIYGLANTCQNISLLNAKGNIISTNTYFLKPSALGEFMLYKNGSVLVDDNGSVLLKNISTTYHGHDYLVWTIVQYGDTYVFRNKSTGKYIQKNISWWTWLPWVSNWISTTNVSSASKFRMSAAENCESFPEISLNATITRDLAGKNADGTLYGMANLHDHFLSDRAMGNLLFTGGTHSPYGVYDAFNCYESHGSRGLDLTSLVAIVHDTTVDTGIHNILNPNFNLFGFAESHNPYSYPGLEAYPSVKDIGHQKVYYQWLNRARLGGLRLITMLSQSSKSIVRIANHGLVKNLLPFFSPGMQITPVITGMEEHEIAMSKLLSLIDYVDAQEGGPGKGWLKIAYSPAQARKIISEGNLAVIIGMEHPDFLNCTENSTPCTRSYIASELDRLYAQGVRVVFPTHHYDNQFSGSSLFAESVELLAMLDINRPIEYQVSDENLPFSTEYIPSIRNGNVSIVLKGLLAIFGYNLFNGFSDIPKDANGELFHGYENARGLTQTGEILVEELLKRGMMIDMSHMSPQAVRDVIAITDEYDYPPLFTHFSIEEGSHHEGDAGYIYTRGGIASPQIDRSQDGRDCAYTSTNLITVFNDTGDVSEQHKGLRSASMSTDFFGTLTGPGPRLNNTFNHCENSTSFGGTMEYPFTSRDGKVVFEKQTSGNQTYDYNYDGMAHIGLLPDLIEDMRIQSDSEGAIAALFNGAEEYVRFWEECERAASRVEDRRAIVSNPEKPRDLREKKDENSINGLPIELLDNSVVSENLAALQSNTQAVESIKDLFNIDITNLTSDEIIHTLIDEYQITAEQIELANDINGTDLNLNAISNSQEDTTNEPIFSKNRISVYPTYVENKVNVESIEDVRDITVTITNISGKVIFTQEYKTLKAETMQGFQKFSPGVYIINFKDKAGNINQSFKVIKK
ncbi:membrane dipeptidase [Tenacibaculum xiamenense]|uniref:membrane dipeptidase n=1 Tax=Tenacibaculum xiamenense TaxID=1261553 RepID=UPI0038954D6E